MSSPVARAAPPLAPSATNDQRFQFGCLPEELQILVLQKIPHAQEEDYGNIALACPPEANITRLALRTAFCSQFPQHPLVLAKPRGDVTEAQQAAHARKLDAYLTAHPSRWAPHLPIHVAREAACLAEASATPALTPFESAMAHGWLVRETHATRVSAQPIHRDSSIHDSISIRVYVGLGDGESLTALDVQGTNPFAALHIQPRDFTVGVAPIAVYPQAQTALIYHLQSGRVGRIAWKENATGNHMPQWVPVDLQIGMHVDTQPILIPLDQRGNIFFMDWARWDETFNPPTCRFIVRFPEDPHAPVHRTPIADPHHMILPKRISPLVMAPNNAWMFVEGWIPGGPIGYYARALVAHPYAEQDPLTGPTWMPIREQRQGDHERELYSTWKHIYFVGNDPQRALVHTGDDKVAYLRVDLASAAPSAELRDLTVVDPGAAVDLSEKLYDVVPWDQNRAAMAWSIVQNGVATTIPKLWHITGFAAGETPTRRPVILSARLNDAWAFNVPHFGYHQLRIVPAPQGDWGLISFPHGLGAIRSDAAGTPTATLLKSFPTQIGAHCEKARAVMAPNGTWAIALHAIGIGDDDAPRTRYYTVVTYHNATVGEAIGTVEAINTTVEDADAMRAQRMRVHMDPQSHFAVIYDGDHVTHTWIVYPNGHAYRIADPSPISEVTPATEESLIFNPAGAAHVTMQRDRANRMRYLDIGSPDQPTWRTLNASSMALLPTLPTHVPLTIDASVTALPTGDIVEFVRVDRHVFTKAAPHAADTTFYPVKWQEKGDGSN